MEKSLKSISSLSLKEINFSGFRLSEGWVGFFEKKDSFSYPLIDEAVSLFEGFFGKEDEGVIVITALSFNDDREDDKETINNYQGLYEEMKNKKLLSPITEEFEYYLYGDSCLPALSLSLSNKRYDFINLSKLMMCHAGVVGQVCFYINLDLNVAIYPHDDIGFGCIALNKEDRVSKEFLNYCAKSESFNVFIDGDNGLVRL
ncbi:hypothetical protein D8B20_02845 [Candidatus Pantoea soli]|uniref:DUF3885 domain-containing protein n=2 Tax=Candidatus Pantoea soli TaxID=3098669 RepID=A0A518XHA1_9GAMM|nr:hypothetical protein D8B20_02845 [Pantoea soli]